VDEIYRRDIDDEQMGTQYVVLGNGGIRNIFAEVSKTIGIPKDKRVQASTDGPAGSGLADRQVRTSLRTRKFNPHHMGGAWVNV